MRSAARMVPALRQALTPLSRAVVAGPSTSLPYMVSRAASTSATFESELPEGSGSGVALPGNLSFEDLSGNRKPSKASLRERGYPLHIKPSDPFEPILHPLSSLTSETPTEPSESGESVPLPSDVFGKPIRRDILHRNVKWYLSTLRQGSQSTKSRSTVAYSGRKLRAQKGAGKARVGDASSGTRRGGAPIHPLQPKNWAEELPRKVRELGLRTALSSKLNSGLLRVVDSITEGQWEGTNEARRALADGPDADGIFTNRFGPAHDLNILFLHAPSKPEAEVAELWRIVRNVPGIEVLPTDEVVAYDVLQYNWVIMETAAVDALSGFDMLKLGDFDGFEGLEGEFDFPADVKAALEAEAAETVDSALSEPAAATDAANRA